MRSFFRKKNIVTQETLGERLSKVRQGKNWSLKKAAEETGISQNNLKYLEKSLYDKILGEVYIKNFIKTYSLKLGLSPQKCLEKYQKEKHIIEEQKQRKFLKEIEPGKIIHQILKPKTIKISAVCLVMIVVLSYIILNLYQTIAPPKLELYYPPDNLEINKIILDVYGKANDEAKIKINQTPVLSQEDGSFRETITLKPGLNTLIISAKRKHGLEKNIIRHILVVLEKNIVKK